MPTEPDDTGRVDPAEHRGRDTGILAKAFKLARHRRDNDITGPKRIEPDPEHQGDDEGCEP